MPRNAPTTFNAGLWDHGLFWDSRVAGLSPEPLSNGLAGLIATPDSGQFDVADVTLPEGTSLPAAQVRFPVTSSAEMRGGFSPGSDNHALRGHAGLYQMLDEVLEHYDNPGQTVDDLFGERNNQPFADNNVPFCNLPQISRIVEASGQACANLYPDAYVNSQLALQRLASNQARSPLGERANLNGRERDEIVAFLEALTDP